MVLAPCLQAPSLESLGSRGEGSVQPRAGSQEHPGEAARPGAITPQAGAVVPGWAAPALRRYSCHHLHSFLQLCNVSGECKIKKKIMI